MLLDAFVLFVLAVSLLIGMLRGLVREIMTLLALAGGVAGAWIGAPLAAPQIATWIGKPTEPLPPGQEMPKFLDMLPFDTAAVILAWAVIILGIVLLVSLLSHVLAEAIKAAGLGGLDGALGALFGVARGAAVVVVMYLPVHVLAGADLREAWLSGGHSYAALEEASAKVLPLIPGIEHQEGEAEGQEGAAAQEQETQAAPQAQETEADLWDRALEEEGQPPESDTGGVYDTWQ